MQMTKALATSSRSRACASTPSRRAGCDRNQPRLSSRAGKKLTRNIPVGRFGEDGDLDGALLLLASDAGAYMAGATNGATADKWWRCAGRLSADDPETVQLSN